MERNPSHRHREAKRVAALLKDKITTDDGELWDGGLTEHLHSLFYNRETGCADEDLITGMREFMVELTTVLTDEDFRTRMSDSYFKKNGGKFLRRLYYFFRLIEEKQAAAYLDWLTLDRYSSNVTMDELQRIKKKYGLE